LRAQHETAGNVELSDEIRARLEYATGAAVGEGMRLHQIVQEMINEIDPLPGSRPAGTATAHGAAPGTMPRVPRPYANAYTGAAHSSAPVAAPTPGAPAA
jgi:hypothetical protein